jgi:hypothetical protein
MAKSYEFENEAIKLGYSIEEDSILHVAGCLFLFLSFCGHGTNTKAGDRFIKEAAQMSARMKLFGVDDALSMKDVEDLSPEQLAVLAHTTWGAFNLFM